MTELLVESSGVVLALLYLVLAMYQLRSCWIVGLISSLLYIIVFYRAALYTESALQIFYALAAVYGYVKWSQESAQQPFQPSYWPLRQHIFAAAFCCLAALLVGELLAVYTDASFPHLDSMLTSFSILATLMTAWKLVENWIYWIFIDLISAGLYVVKGLTLTAGLFGVYVVLAILGWREWRAEAVRCNVGADEETR